MPCVQDRPYDSGPDRSHGAAYCIIAATGFLMNHPLQKAGFLQTALPQVEGEPRSTIEQSVAVTPVDSLINAEALERDLYSMAIPLYTEMVMASAQAAAQTGGDPAKKQYKDSRDKAARELIKIFDDYSNAVRQPLFDGTTGRLMGLRGLHAIYSRANAYLAQPAAGSVPDLDLNMTKAIPTKWLDDQSLAALGASSTGATAPAFFLVKNVGGISFKRQEKLLFDFEKALHKLMPMSDADGSKPALALNVAQLAAFAGLSRKVDDTTSTSYATQLVSQYKASLNASEVRNVYLVALAHIFAAGRNRKRHSQDNWCAIHSRSIGCSERSRRRRAVRGISIRPDVRRIQAAPRGPDEVQRSQLGA
jgi:hypothetical protein